MRGVRLNWTVILLIGFLGKETQQLSVKVDIRNLCVGRMDGEFLPNPTACDAFYQCMDEEVYDQRCPSNKWFNPKISNCDASPSRCTIAEPQQLPPGSINPATPKTTTASKATTTTKTTTPSTTTTTVRTTTTTSAPKTSAIPLTTAPTTTTVSTVLTNMNIEPNINCPKNNPQDVVFLASNTDCERYYLCYNGNPIKMQCISGMHWNQPEQQCDYPVYSHCQVNRKPDVQPIPKCPRRGVHFQPHPYVCEYFVYCEEGIQSIQQCPFLYHWDITQERCIIKNLAVCVRSLL